MTAILGGVGFAEQSSMGACLVANEPEGLGQKMINRRIEGKSWKEIADEFSLGSPSTARAQFAKLTGINDFKSKGDALKALVKNLEGLEKSQIKAATTAVKDVAKAVSDQPTAGSSAKAFNEARKNVLDTYGQEVLSKLDIALQQGKGYGALQDITHMPLSEIDNYNWNRLLSQHKGDVFKAYSEKPSSEAGFKAVKEAVGKERAIGLSEKEVAQLLNMPEEVVQAIDKGTWKIAGPGSKTVHIPPPPPAPPQVTEIPGFDPGSFRFHSKEEMDQWIQSLGSDLTDAELKAVRAYTGSSYRDINNSLRQGVDNKYVKLIDKAMRPLPFDTKVARHVGLEAFRGMGVINPKQLLAQVGKVWSDKGYLSTTIVQGGVWSGNVFIHIDVPKGSLGRWVGNGVSTHTGEREMILARGTKMMITKVEWNGQAKGIVNVFMRII